MSAIEPAAAASRRDDGGGLAMVAIAAAFVQSGGSITGLVGASPPPADTFEVRRVQFQPGEIRVLVRNPQPEDLTIAVVTVDDAVVPFALDGGATLGRLRSRISRSTGPACCSPSW